MSKSTTRWPTSQRLIRPLRSIREILVRPYRVMYRRTDDRVEIAAIRHEAREFDEKALES